MVSTHQEHKSSARDMPDLRRRLFALDVPRDYVTRQRGDAEGTERVDAEHCVGRTRTSCWGIEGYLGAKTGTTDAAGVRVLFRRVVVVEKEQIVVVLGSALPGGRGTRTRGTCIGGDGRAGSRHGPNRGPGGTSVRGAEATPSCPPEAWPSRDISKEHAWAQRGPRAGCLLTDPCGLQGERGEL